MNGAEKNIKYHYSISLKKYKNINVLMYIYPKCVLCGTGIPFTTKQYVSPGISSASECEEAFFIIFFRKLSKKRLGNEKSGRRDKNLEINGFGRLPPLMTAGDEDIRMQTRNEWRRLSRFEILKPMN